MSPSCFFFAKETMIIIETYAHIYKEEYIMSKIMNKVKETTRKGKEFVSDHKETIYAGAVFGIWLGGLTYIVKTNKKYEKMWRLAKTALDNGDRTADYGPYNIIEIFEPKTLKSLGKTVCHKDTCDAFLNLK